MRSWWTTSWSLKYSKLLSKWPVKKPKDRSTYFWLFLGGWETQSSEFSTRKVRFKKVYETVFFPMKISFSQKFFDLCVLWSRKLVRWKALIQADLLDTHNVYPRPLEKFLQPSEVVGFRKIWVYLKNRCRFTILWSEYQITKTTILSRFPPTKCFYACYRSENVLNVFSRSRRTCYIPTTPHDMP